MQIDTEILLWINGHYTPFWDSVMWAASGRLTWIPLYVLMLVAVWFFLPEKSSARRVTLFALALLVVGLMVALTDQTCHILKSMIARPRPSHAPELDGLLHLVRGYTGGQYGHPSSHAANTMAISTFILLFTGRGPVLHARWARGLWVFVLLLFVCLNCYSRMYLGVHYPSDILVGLFIGLAFGGLAYGALLRLFAVADRSDGSQSGGTDPHSVSSPGS